MALRSTMSFEAVFVYNLIEERIVSLMKLYFLPPKYEFGNTAAVTVIQQLSKVMPLSQLTSTLLFTHLTKEFQFLRSFEIPYLFDTLMVDLLLPHGCFDVYCNFAKATQQAAYHKGDRSKRHS